MVKVLLETEGRKTVWQTTRRRRSFEILMLQSGRVTNPARLFSGLESGPQMAKLGESLFPSSDTQSGP